jgi:pimeloyl-ACP methyl ester carboxylesterase
MFVTRDGARLYCRVEGQGEPALVFVHGGGVDHSTWDEHMEHFAPRHRVVAMDLRGHGQSDPVDSYTQDLLRDDLVAIIDELKLAPAVIIGASRGGGIANRVAVDYPGRVKAMVFVDYGAAQGRSPESSSWKSSPQEAVQQFASLAADWREAGARRLVDSWFPEPDVPESLKARLAGLCMQTDPAVVQDMRVREAEVPDREEYLTRITMPTLILQSGSGRHQGREQGKFIHDRVRGSQLHYFEGRGHGFFMSAPEEFWAKVEDFLATL